MSPTAAIAATTTAPAAAIATAPAPPAAAAAASSLHAAPTAPAAPAAPAAALPLTSPACKASRETSRLPGPDRGAGGPNLTLTPAATLTSTLTLT